MPEIRARLRPLLLLVACSVAVTSVGGPAAASSSDRIDQIVKRMTLEEKVGQLFVTYVYGQTADTTDPADVAHNQQELGVANGKELIEKYHLGGVIYFAWSEQRGEPAADRRPVQRPAAGRDLLSGADIPLLISTDQEQGVVTRVGPPATQLPGNMALGAGRSDGRHVRRAAGSPARSCGPIGINQRLRARRRRQRQRAQPGDRGPVLRLRPDPGLRRWCRRSVDGYQRRERRRHRRSTSRATATPPPTATSACRSSTTPAPQWERIDAPPFRAAIKPGHRHDHDGAHRRPRARPVRRPGDAVQADHHRHPARRAGLRGRHHHRLADHAGRARRLRRRPHPGAGAQGRRRPAADAPPASWTSPTTRCSTRCAPVELTEERHRRVGRTACCS